MGYLFSLAPLQGITDYVFRNLFCKHFAGIEKVYSPFLRLQNNKTLKNTHVTDILPENNSASNLIPQVLCNTADDLIYLVNLLADYGYKEVNWNLGCPYPMVAKRQLGSGLLPFPDHIDEILDKSYPLLKSKLSVKLRSGYESEEEIINLFPVFNKYDISELIIHPRIGKQIYKGNANPDIIDGCLDVSKNSIAYNGDIFSIDSFKMLKKRFSEINHWMIGRALITNPFLVEEIISGIKISSKVKLERFSEFHYEIYDFYLSSLSGPGHILNKMQHLWEYFSKSFSNSHKVNKLIKKAKSIEKLDLALYYIFNSEEFQ